LAQIDSYRLLWPWTEVPLYITGAYTLFGRLVNTENCALPDVSNCPGVPGIRVSVTATGGGGDIVPVDVRKLNPSQFFRGVPPQPVNLGADVNPDTHPQPTEALRQGLKQNLTVHPIQGLKEHFTANTRENFTVMTRDQTHTAPGRTGPPQTIEVTTNADGYFAFSVSSTQIGSTLISATADIPGQGIIPGFEDQVGQLHAVVALH
jgi:hypothetical protein